MCLFKDNEGSILDGQTPPVPIPALAPQGQRVEADSNRSQSKQLKSRLIDGSKRDRTEMVSISPIMKVQILARHASEDRQLSLADDPMPIRKALNFWS